MRARYIKCLESIKDVRKEQTIKVKEYDIELKHLQENKVQAESLKKRLEKTEADMELMEQESSKLSQELMPINVAAFHESVINQYLGICGSLRHSAGIDQ